MLSFASSFLAIAVAFTLPSLAGLIIVRGVSTFANPRYIAAFALGVYFWFFSDTIGDSAYLGNASGLAWGPEQIALVLIFVAGLLIPFTVDRKSFQGVSGTGSAGLGVPILVALAVGIHGLGEAAATSAIAASTPYQDFLSAFGGLSPAIAFVIHKTLEPVIVGAAYVIYAKDHAKSTLRTLKDLVILTLVFVLPGLIGAVTGYAFSYDTTYVFASGLGASIYAAVRMANPLIVSSGSPKGYSAKAALAIALGFLCLYFASLFHA